MDAYVSCTEIIHILCRFASLYYTNWELLYEIRISFNWWENYYFLSITKDSLSQIGKTLPPGRPTLRILIFRPTWPVNSQRVLSYLLHNITMQILHWYLWVCKLYSRRVRCFSKELNCLNELALLAHILNRVQQSCINNTINHTISTLAQLFPR